jgi:hypothetical protein
MRFFRSAKRLSGQSTEGIPRPAGYRWQGTWQDLVWRQRVRIGLPLALGYAWLARPTGYALAGGAVVSFLGVVVRGSTAGHLRKNLELTTSGPYAFTRHPLYLGSLLIAAGFLLAGRSLLADALGVAYFGLFYGAAISREERRLAGRFGAEFAAYAARVPRFWPRLTWNPGGAPFSWRLYWQNGEYQAALGVLAGVVFLWLEMRWRG